MKVLGLTLISLVFVETLWAQESLFEDDFKGHVGPGWSWVREHREA